MAPEDVRFLLVHHTAGSNSYSPDSVARQIAGMYDFHTGPDKGWPDIAYNFLIDRYGEVWEARTGSLAGAVAGDATGGNQGFSQLVSLMGNFSAESPTDEALEAMRRTLAWLADRHDLSTTPGATATFVSRGSNKHATGASVSTPVINGHRSMSSTSCPGDVLFSYVSGGLLADVQALRLHEGANQSASTSTTAPTESDTTSSTSSSTSSSSDPDSGSTVAGPAESETTPAPTRPGVEPTDDARGGASTPGEPADSSSSSSPEVDTVNGVAAPSANQGIGQEGVSDGDGSLAAWQGAAIAGAGVAAATAGLLALRRRDTADDPESDRA